MNIGVDARPLLAPYSGIGRYTLELLRRLCVQGSHHWFLYANAAPEIDLPDVTAVRWGHRAGQVAGLYYSQWHFPAWARSDALDVFWSPRHHLSLRGYTMPTVVTIHDLVWRLMPQTMRRGNAWVEQLLMPRSIAMANRLIAVSEATRQDLIRLMPGSAAKTSVIHEASSLDAPIPTAAQPIEPYLLWVGTLEPRKNLPRMLDAYALARSRNESVPDLTLVVNQGWRSEEIETLLSSRKLQAVTQVHAKVSDAELAALYAGCYCLLHPALYEGFALPLVEAMSFGKPVITSDRSAMPEVAGNAGLLVDPHNEVALADAIQNLASNAELYARLSAAAKERSAQFDWDQAAHATLTVLEQAGSSAIPAQ